MPKENAMAEVKQCRCGKPLIDTGTGGVFCDHCDRGGCKGLAGGCIDCHLLDKATKALAARTGP